MFSCLACDVAAGRVLARRQATNRERKQTEAVVVRCMVVWWARTAVAGSIEIIDRLLETEPFSVPGGVLWERPEIRLKVISCPMMPCAKWSIRIVAEEHEASGLLRWITPFYGRGEIFTVAGIAPRDRRSVGKGG